MEYLKLPNTNVLVTVTPTCFKILSILVNLLRRVFPSARKFREVDEKNDMHFQRRSHKRKVDSTYLGTYVHEGN